VVAGLVKRCGDEMALPELRPLLDADYPKWQAAMMYDHVVQLAD
jgi:hypothetical protein